MVSHTTYEGVIAKIHLELWCEQSVKDLQKEIAKERKKLRAGTNVTKLVSTTSDNDPPEYQTSQFADDNLVDGLGDGSSKFHSDDFLVNLQHEHLFTIPEVASNDTTHQGTSDAGLRVETCALEMLLASARANAYKCTNILELRPGLMSHQIVGRNGLWPTPRDQIYHSKEQRNPYAYQNFSEICRISSQAIIDVLSEALSRYDEDPEILWSLFNHQSVSYAANGLDVMDFLSAYASKPLKVTSPNDIRREVKSEEIALETILKTQRTAQSSSYERRMIQKV